MRGHSQGDRRALPPRRGWSRQAVQGAQGHTGGRVKPCAARASELCAQRLITWRGTCCSRQVLRRRKASLARLSACQEEGLWRLTKTSAGYRGVTAIREGVSDQNFKRNLRRFRRSKTIKSDGRENAFRAVWRHWKASDVASKRNQESTRNDTPGIGRGDRSHGAAVQAVQERLERLERRLERGSSQARFASAVQAWTAPEAVQAQACVQALEIIRPSALRARWAKQKHMTFEGLSDFSWFWTRTGRRLVRLVQTDVTFGVTRS